jgi:hypothetical protein
MPESHATLKRRPEWIESIYERLAEDDEGNKRTDYVAVSNTVIGALLLVSGLLGALAATVSVESTILLLGLAGLAGSFLSLRWKEVSG